MNNYPRIIVMTCDPYLNLLKGYFHCLEKFWRPVPQVLVCGFSKPKFKLPSYAEFFSIGNFNDYPPDKWSNAFLRVLNNIPDEVFLLNLEDYWLYRDVDTKAVKMLYDYMHQFKNVLKIDTARERRWLSDNTKGIGLGSCFIQENATYGHCGYLDLLKSPPTSEYHMSLWGGLWRKNLLQKFIVPGERAQEIEMWGTPRVRAEGDNVLVLGTRQGPIMHGNILLSGQKYLQLQPFSPNIIVELAKKGYLDNLPKGLGE